MSLLSSPLEVVPLVDLALTFQRQVFKAAGGRRGFDSLRRLLDVTGITVFVGPNGSGKSFCAVAALLPSLTGVQWTCWDEHHEHFGPLRAHDAGCAVCPNEQARCDVGQQLREECSVGVRKVYSSVELTLPNGDPHPLFVPLVDYRQLIGIEHSEVFFDEVAGVSDASDSGSIPVQVTQWLHTLRKRDVRLIVTTPAYSRCSKPIRQVAQVVVDCRAHFAAPATEGRRWRPRRMLTATAFDAFSFEDFTAGKKEQLSPLTKGALWVPGHPAGTAYSTLGQVFMLGHVTEAGMCSSCGGSRSRPRCACVDDELARARAIEVVEKVSASGARVRQAVAVSLPASHGNSV